MKFPSIFVNHGGGPLPLMGAQPNVANHLLDVVANHIPPTKPKALIVVSAHWEEEPVRIISGAKPAMYFDYYGFPPETYKYKYDAPGHPELAQKIQSIFNDNGIESQLDEKRGYDHGIFVPLKIMYPDADIPVVGISLHASLNAQIHVKIGSALEKLRNEVDDVLLLGSGFTFHNMRLLFNPSSKGRTASVEFNEWLKSTMTSSTSEQRIDEMVKWTSHPYARVCHPREEHLLPLFVCAAAAGGKGTMIAEEKGGDFVYSAYKFEDES